MAKEIRWTVPAIAINMLASLPPLRWNGRHGASLETLAGRVMRGGRKGRRAGRRILRREYPHMVSDA